MTHRPTGWGYYRISYTLSRSMNSVGEFFFSSPIDPMDLSKDWGRSDDDQRHRLVMSGAIHTSMEPARSVAARLLNGFQVSAMLQASSAPPLNVTSGMTTIQGTPGRPVLGRAAPSPVDVRAVTFIPRNAGVGSDYFSVNLRIGRTIRVGDRTNIEVLAEAFNLTNHQNAVARNGNFGTGAYPSNPSASFGQVTSVGEPRSFQLGARVRF